MAPEPSMTRIGTSLGGAPKESACEAFGRSSGLFALIGQRIGLPPEWIRKGGSQEASAENRLRLPNERSPMMRGLLPHKARSATPKHLLIYHFKIIGGAEAYNLPTLRRGC
jgi:hypothetical protein